MPQVVRTSKRIVERTVQDRIQAALGKIDGVTVYRNTVGTYETMRAGWVTCGLGEGTADLVGWVRVQVYAPKPVRISRFLALEVKTLHNHHGKEARHEQNQLAWLEFVRSQGGVADIVHSAEEAIDLVLRAKRWEV